LIGKIEKKCIFAAVKGSAALNKRNLTHKEISELIST
jgi:hypothetical protein